MNPQQVLQQYNLKPSKGLSQNFMVDSSALDRMARAAGLEPSDVVLEVGAGLGALTRVLAERAGRVVAVEVDERLIPLLRAAVAPFPNVSLVSGDMLELEPGLLVGGVPYKVVANVPYHITSALLRHLLESELPPSLLVLTVQREVAERMAAKPGQMSLLAVSVQFYGRVEVVARLKPGAFYPRPGVDSAVVRVVPYPEPLLPPNARAGFFRVARAGFNQRRKQLKNSLAAGLGLAAGAVAAQMERAEVDPSRRAETLSLAEWRVLAETFAPKD